MVGVFMSLLDNYMKKVKKEKWSLAAISFLASIDLIKKKSPTVAESILQELKDQRSFLKLIASENFSSLAVQQAMGNLLTDKYSEGFIGHRFYAGCANVDKVEEEATELAKQIFKAEYAYVQPHSGSDANQIAFWSILMQRIQKKGIEALHKKNLDELSEEEYERIRKELVSQKVMGMSMSSGGHLTHGYKHNISSKMMRSVSYDVDPKTGLINYKTLEEQAKRERPLILIGGYSAYPRLIDFAKMREIADSVGATLLVDMAHFAGLVAGKVFKGNYNPVEFAHIVTSTTHKTLRGPRGGLVLAKEEFKEVLNKGCPLVQGGPLPHVMAAKAVAFKEASTKDFCLYAEQIVKNAKSLANKLQVLGSFLLTGGTDNHLLVINVKKSFGLTGKQSESALRQAGLTVNRNSIPFDTESPWHTSGLRIGTAALTTLGMKEKEMELIAETIVNVLRHTTAQEMEAIVEEKILSSSRKTVKELLTDFPLYPELIID